MNVLFLTLVDFDDISAHNIYTDLLREFAKRRHSVYVVSPVEKKKNHPTQIVEGKDVTIIKLQVDDIHTVNLIKKGISTLTIEKRFISGIKRYFSNVHFDLLLYSTPPITLCNAVEYVKKRDGAKTYLLLKDIFPQNAVDMGMMSKTGIKSVIYKYFRKKENKFYAISDHIGCMSPANVDFVIKNNPEVDPSVVEVCPNSVDPVDMSVDSETRALLKAKYGIPLDKKVFVYGGNLGKPQGIDFLIECLRSQKDNGKVFFLVVGQGTEYGKLESYVNNSGQANVKLMKYLPKDDYDKMVGACDVGLIFLDHRFTIPNFPSRLLSYMQAKIPVLAATDPNTDIGSIAVNGGFGWWCESNDVNAFDSCIQECLSSDLMKVMGEKGWQYLCENYTVEQTYKTIMKHYGE